MDQDLQINWSPIQPKAKGFQGQILPEDVPEFITGVERYTESTPPEDIGPGSMVTGQEQINTDIYDTYSTAYNVARAEGGADFDYLTPNELALLIDVAKAPELYHSSYSHIITLLTYDGLANSMAGSMARKILTCLIKTPIKSGGKASDVQTQLDSMDKSAPGFKLNYNQVLALAGKKVPGPKDKKDGSALSQEERMQLMMQIGQTSSKQRPKQSPGIKIT